MSLVGNLEDLSLGDIMQIISLSQKSGLLVLKSDQGSGQIVFSAGLVHAAHLTGVEAPNDDLRGLLVGHGILDAAGFDTYVERAVELGLSVEETLSREVELDSERINSLLKESVESAVIEMFSWSSGDFSFDVPSETEFASSPLVLETGINAQYLAMEGMRVLDEGGRAGEPVAEGQPADPIDARQEDPAVAPPSDLEPAESQAAANVLVAKVLESDARPAVAAQVEAAEGKAVPPLAAAESASDHVDSSLVGRATAHSGTLILVDPDVVVLDWVKDTLSASFDRVHVFQRSEQGLARIRQYLVRGELPVVLISLEVEVDPLSGIHGLADFVKRLKAQAAQLTVLGLIEEGQEPRPALTSSFDGLLVRPVRNDLLAAAAKEDDPSARALSGAMARLLADPKPDPRRSG